MRNVVPLPEPGGRSGPAVMAPGSRPVRMLGWFLAANAVAVAVALIGSASAATGAAHQFAVWCGIG